MQFVTGRQREGYRAYAFVEDDDDKSFYQLALTQYQCICYLGCGGKSGVMAIYEKLHEDNLANTNLFFVDRDTESLPFVHPQGVHRTQFYSWESYVCQAEYVAWYLQRKIEPNLSPQETATLMRKWTDTIENFRESLARHVALCRTALVIEESLGMSELILTKGCSGHELTIRPGGGTEDWYKQKLEIAIEYGVTQTDVERRVSIFLSLDIGKFSRGKTIFMILREFVSNYLRESGRRFRGSYNSAKQWLDGMPWTWQDLDPIRTYATNRMTVVPQGSHLPLSHSAAP